MPGKESIGPYITGYTDGFYDGYTAGLLERLFGEIMEELENDNNKNNIGSRTCGNADFCASA